MDANPDLAAARQEIGIADGARKQAGLIPNPTISYDVEDTRAGKHNKNCRESKEHRMKIKVPLYLAAVSALSGSYAISAQAEDKPEGFIEGSSLTVLNRNYR